GEGLHDARVSIEREDLAAGENEIGRGHGAYSTIAPHALATAGTGSICFAILRCERPGSPQRIPTCASGYQGARAPSGSQLAPVREAQDCSCSPGQPTTSGWRARCGMGEVRIRAAWTRKP